MAGAYTPTPIDSANLQRCANALEQIAAVLTLIIAQPAEMPECPHPDSDREVAPGSTMAHLAYQCKACGRPCPEAGA